MGKAQSKRSIDITTDPKKVGEDGNAVAGKVEKIEDLDQAAAAAPPAAAANGDAATPPQEKTEDAAAAGGEVWNAQKNNRENLWKYSIIIFICIIL